MAPICRAKAQRESPLAQSKRRRERDGTNECQPLMTQPEQMLGGDRAGAERIVLYGGEDLRPLIDQHHIQPAQIRLGEFILADARDDHSVDLAVHQCLEVLSYANLAGLAEEHGISRRGRHTLCAGNDRRVDGVRESGDNDPERERATMDEALREPVRSVAKLFRNLNDASSRFRGDTSPRVVGQHKRDGGL